MSNLSTNRKVLGFIDAWGGGTACALLTLARRLWPFGGASEKDRTGVLFVKLAEQGSTVLASQAIRDAVERHGAKNTYFLVFEENRFILDALDIVPHENVLAIKTKNASTMALHGLKQLLRIRQLRLLACVDLEFFARSTAVISFLTGIPRRVGFHGWHSEGPFRGNLFTHRLRYNPHVHTSTIFRCLVAAVNADPAALPRFDWVADEVPVTPPAFQPTEAEVVKIRDLIAKSTGGQHRSIVLLNANASDLLPLRKWDNDNYVQLARKIIDTIPDAWVAFTGGPSEREKIDALAATVERDRVFSMAGRTSLRELMVLYAQSDVLVTNDSGPAHFAALTPIDTVVLFGPETPKLFATLSARNHSITANLACSPCVSALNNRQTSCTNNVCMQRILVPQVYEAVWQALDHRGKLAPAIS
jgi:ADP-heptose:LPS heptosyltransferase